MSGYVKSAIKRILWRRIQIRAFAQCVRVRMLILPTWYNQWQILREIRMSKNTWITSITTKASSHRLQIQLVRQIATTGSSHSHTTRHREAITVHMEDHQVASRHIPRAIPIQLDREGTLRRKQQVALRVWPRRWVRLIQVVSRSMEMVNYKSVTDAWISLPIWATAKWYASNARRVMPARSRGSSRAATFRCSRATRQANQDLMAEQESSSSNSTTQIEISRAVKTRTWAVVTTVSTFKPLLSSNSTLSSPKTKMTTNSREKASSINAWNVRNTLCMSKTTSIVKTPGAQAMLSLSTCKSPK